MRPEARIAGFFAVIAAVLLASLGVAFWFGQQTIQKNKEVERHRVAIALLNDTLSTIKDAETGQRGFLITRDEDYRQPYDQAVTLIRSNLNALRTHFEPQQVDSLESTINERIKVLEANLSLAQSGQIDAAVTNVRTGTGKAIMDSLRAEVRRLGEQRESLLHEAQDAAGRATNLRTVVFVAIILFNLAFLGWAYFRIRSEVSLRMDATRESRRQKDLLAVTLTSIGDAVILADTNAHIVYMNPVAERLTGWTLAEAASQPCASVFRIINEQSRAIVESPVEKVLRQGTIVGLANHTLLIRKDGSEVPIDDSGAPVREENGAVRGVVLIFRDFSEHKSAEQDLRRAKEELEQAARVKDQFLATLSHELRTPLTPVLTTLNLWEASTDLPEDFRSDIVMLRRNIELEARLIDDLLDLTRIAQGKLSLNPELCDVHDILIAAIEVYRSEIQGKRLEVVTRFQARRRVVTADCARIQQVFWNIIKNATKFTPEGGRITIETRNDNEGRIVVSISDTGIGMSAEELTSVFKPFVQGTTDSHRRHGGLGLGLAIARAFTEAHGGTIDASSPGPTKGTTFTFRMLALDVSTPDLSAVSNPKPIVESAEKLRVLLIEDHADSATVLARLLARMGHAVQVCDSVRATMEVLARGDGFDLVLSDIGLPDGTGVDLIREIRKQHRWPAVALTGYGMEDDIIRCREAGFDGHITKPVSVQNLEAILRTYGKIDC